MRGLFDFEVKSSKIEELEKLLNKNDIWEDPKATEISSELTTLKKDVSVFVFLTKELQNLKELISLKDELETDMLLEIGNEIDALEIKLNELETSLLLNGEYDNTNCFLEIHPGAGGTESCDWAQMILEMYEKFCEIENFKTELVDYEKGEEAGLKRVTLKIKGNLAYGKLKSEHGVHRLVRISPFDSNHRRHTSFASVTVIPEFKNVDISIKEADLKIDVYRSSGAGGQHVNTTDSAVRITHLPTKTVVTCQNERSQLKNKEYAMNMLKNKLFQLELEAKNKNIQVVCGQMQEINFGSQIRSYILEPYTRVIDHRTLYETSNVVKVLDGNIMAFIEAYLRKSNQ